MADGASALPPRADLRSGCSTPASSKLRNGRNDTNSCEIMEAEESQSTRPKSTGNQEMVFPSISETDYSDLSQITCGQKDLIHNQTTSISTYDPDPQAGTASQLIETIPEISFDLDFTLNNEHRQTLPSQPHNSSSNGFNNTHYQSSISEVQDIHNIDLNEIEMPSQLPSTSDLYYLKSQTPERTEQVHQKAKQHRQLLPLINPTLESMGKNNVILIKIQSDDNKEILTNPILINKLIYESDFKKLRIKDIRINKKKDIIAIENSDPLSVREIDILTKIENLGKYQTKCYIPNLEKYSYGVIGPISSDIDLEELRHQLTIENDLNIVRIERLKRREGNLWIDSKSLKLVFTSNIFPSEVSVFRMKYKVRAYIPDPMQCYRCQRLGHTSKSCTAKYQRCMLCGGAHSKNECTAVKRYCVNCREEGHPSNSRQCPSLATAREIDKVMAERRVDYMTARLTVTEAQNPKPKMNLTMNAREFPNIFNPNLPESSSHNHSTNQISQQVSKTYAQKAAAPRLNLETQYPHERQHPKKNHRNISTQTDEHDSNRREQLDKKFFLNLRNLILDIMSLNTTNDNQQTRINLADNALKVNFGIDLSPENDTNLDENNNSKQKRKRKKASPSGIQYVEKTSTEEEDVLSNNASQDSETDGNEIWETVEKTIRKKEDKNSIPQARRSKRKKKSINKNPKS